VWLPLNRIEQRSLERRESEQRRQQHEMRFSMPEKKPDREPPTEREILAKIAETFIKNYADWILSAIVAVLLAFMIGILRWDSDGLRFGSRRDTLSLLGVWVLCYWAVSLALKAIKQRL
jgi:hypothetical protein